MPSSSYVNLIKEAAKDQLLIWSWRRAFLISSIRKHLFRSFLILLATYAIIVGLQMLYPKSLSLPYTYIAGNSYGLKSEQAVNNFVEDQGSKKISIDLDRAEIVIAPADAGLTVNVDGTKRNAMNYPFKQRLIPFSVFKKNNVSLSVDIKDEALELFAKNITAYDKKATDASVQIKGTTTTVIPSVDGYGYDESKVKDIVSKVRLDKSETIKVSPSVLKPKITTEAAQAVARNITDRISNEFTIDAAGSKVIINKAQLASWIVISSNSSEGTIDYSFDRALIKSSILSLNTYVYIAESNNSVVMIDGVQLSNSPGSSGRALVLEASIDAAVDALKKDAKSASIVSQEVTPSTKISRTYTASSKGLNALFSYWSQSHSGTFGISFANAAGTINASYNGDKQFTSASVYKMYVAFVAYHKVENGDMNLSDITSTGRTLESCIQLMITISDNTCAIAIGDMIGWNANDSLLASRGYSSTTIKSNGHLTTANNTSKLLMDLYNGTLINSTHRSTLLGYMETQIFRRGIPAGVSGTVADKVGFLDEFNHDAAIVFSAKGDYVLTIMTSGSSFDEIADLAGQVSDILNQ